MTNLIAWRAQMTNEVRAKSRKRNPCPHVSQNDRALIDAAVAAGRVSVHPTAFVAPTRQAEMSR
jgi:hypothetical protein